MYNKILVALDASPADGAIIEHISELAPIHHSRVILIRVAHAHTRDQMTHESEESEEYVSDVARQFAEQGIEAEQVVVYGEPAEEIMKFAIARNVDLIAMSTHGHRGIYDLVFGSVSDEVRHGVTIPVLLVRSKA